MPDNGLTFLPGQVKIQLSRVFCVNVKSYFINSSNVLYATEYPIMLCGVYKDAEQLI